MRLGVQVVWEINADTRTVTVYRAGMDPRVFGEQDTLAETNLIPGFEMRVEALFQW